VSTRRFWTPEWDGSDLGLAGWAKSFTDAAVIAVGSVGLDIDVMASLAGQEGRPTGTSRIGELVRRFQRGDFDLVSVGRSQIGDPNWVTKTTDHRIPDIRGFRANDTSLSHDVVTTLPTTPRPGGIPGDTVDEYAGDLARRLAARVRRP
jgi:2,4-dienoyl-CoA reductase-like NADH-dependent reductase (Old Yellow Enzyme family)